MLMTETNTPTVYRKVLRAARVRLGKRRRLQAVGPEGDYLDFERVSQGEEDG